MIHADGRVTWGEIALCMHEPETETKRNHLERIRGIDPILARTRMQIQKRLPPLLSQSRFSKGADLCFLPSLCIPRGSVSHIMFYMLTEAKLEFLVVGQVEVEHCGFIALQSCRIQGRCL